MEIEKLMKTLDLTREEAIQLVKDDKAIDKGAKMFELTEEQTKASKKARQAQRTPTVYQFKPRERKPDADKSFLLNILFSAILPICDSYKITNGEREFLFTYNGKKYKIVLSAPRS